MSVLSKRVCRHVLHGPALVAAVNRTVSYSTAEGNHVPADPKLYSLAKSTTATPVAPKTTIANMAFSAIAIQATVIVGILPGFPSHWYVDYELWGKNPQKCGEELGLEMW